RLGKSVPGHRTPKQATRGTAKDASDAQSKAVDEVDTRWLLA
ncbi:MAG: hypothetical protein QOJ88_1489, partial [Pyrinomonadaceae bacterium]|nr:hypothetical protein [Pyrinomonadaceae bacterium]